MTAIQLLDKQIGELEVELQKEPLTYNELQNLNQRIGKIAQEILGWKEPAKEVADLSGRLLKLFSNLTSRIGVGQFTSIARADHAAVGRDGSNRTLSLQGSLADTSYSQVGEHANLLVIAGATEELAKLLSQKALDNGFFEKAIPINSLISNGPVFQGNGSIYVGSGSNVFYAPVNPQPATIPPVLIKQKIVRTLQACYKSRNTIPRLLR